MHAYIHAHTCRGSFWMASYKMSHGVGRALGFALASHRMYKMASALPQVPSGTHATARARVSVSVCVCVCVCVCVDIIHTCTGVTVFVCCFCASSVYAFART